MIVIGLDPGLAGGLAVVRTSPKWEPLHLISWDHRSRKGQPKIGRAGLARKFADSLSAARPYFGAASFKHPSLSRSAALGWPVVTEQTSSRPGQGIASTHRFGLAQGLVEGFITGHGNVNFIRVSPAKWKRQLGLNGDKRNSIELAACWYPHRKWLMKDHNLAEALLLVAWYALAEAHRELDPKHGGKWGILQ